MDGVADRLAPTATAPLLDLLDHPSPGVRTAAFEAATRLPLGPSDWLRVAEHTSAVLRGAG